MELRSAHVLTCGPRGLAGPAGAALYSPVVSRMGPPRHADVALKILESTRAVAPGNRDFLSSTYSIKINLRFRVTL